MTKIAFKKLKNTCKTLFCMALFLTFTIQHTFSQNQTKEEKKIYKKAKNLLEIESYKAAQINYLRLVELNPNNKIYNYEGGLSYYLSNFEQTKSIPLFEASLNNSADDTIPELFYYLGRAYHLDGQHKKSTEAFTSLKKFIKIKTNDGKRLLKEAEYYTQLNSTGKELALAKNDSIKVINLGDKINSDNGDYAPILNPKNDILLFTSRRKLNSKKTDKDLIPFENIFIANKNKDSWQLITDTKEQEKYLPKNYNSKKHDAGITYSADGNVLYTYKKDAIWKSEKTSDGWTKLVELDKNINSSRLNTPSLTISKDGNLMFFTANRNDGIGGKDIYKSIKNNEGNWGVATNLGATINTVHDEDSPYLSEDSKTLYFSSKGHNTMGGYDIFSTSLNEEGNWSTPKNLGIPINSPKDDIFYILEKGGLNGFLSSNRKETIGGMDLFSFCLNCPTIITHIINGLFVNAEDVPINNAKITFQKQNTDSNVTAITNDGKFNFTTHNFGMHNLIAETINYKKQSLTLDLPNKSSTSNLTFKLSQFIKDGEAYQVFTSTNLELNTVISDTIKNNDLIVATNTDQLDAIATYHQKFNYNQREVNINSTEFQKLINKAIKKGGVIYISIETSSSRVPTKTFGSNEKLAKLRAEASKEILIKVLKEKGLYSKNIVVQTVKSGINGPKYSYDYKNEAKYQHYQYVNIIVK